LYILKDCVTDPDETKTVSNFMLSLLNDTWASASVVNPSLLQLFSINARQEMKMMILW
jgi:hypothetical protein